MTSETNAPAAAGLPRLAGWWRRFFAWLYEGLLLVPVLLIAQALFQGTYQIAMQAQVTDVAAHAWSRTLNFVFLSTITFLYFAWCWRRGGQTLAMKTWRIRLVAHDGGPVSWRAAAVRFVAAALCWLPLFPLWFLARREAQMIPYAWFSLGLFLAPFFWSFADRERQFLHDRLAGTQLLFAPKQPKDVDAAVAPQTAD
ncbi:Uncharacterized membrane protein YckC, RDD family [Andreprevotia lacus DSM 23236]|jgi:uncharacterized RDD family membrane protein YckC|uniref:Uncharacterized membrane protein YckC, RDD family n=1 Tax=Andreprevotia lacus DSM 23236 TaxID=1121001 RepID=A0A1W1Y106_9NEIS|nr:RDD family protein [Andreprevotia lacus]SMC29815.1 Uncharacterized membrane protein YckC, RDD family [Andreprevotia lacus DSM 23236]